MAEKKSRLGGRLIKFSAILAVLGIVVAAIVVKGFEQADVKLNTQNLWVLHKDQIKNAAYYGQVNTGLSELTSVNSVARKPGSILQSEYGATLLEAGNVTMADIDLAAPEDFAKDSGAFETLIDSTTASIAGNVIAFFGSTNGSVSFTKIVEGQTPLPQSVGKPEALGTGVFAAATVSTEGVIYAFSPQTSKVYSYDTAALKWVGEGADAQGAAEGDYQLTAIGDKWVLLDQTAGRVWVDGAGGSKTFEPSTTAKLQTPSPASSDGYFSTAEAIFSISLTAGDVKEVQRASGANSAPTWFEGNVYAAWLNSTDGAVFNSSKAELTDLNGFAAGRELGETLDPVVQTNGSAAIVNDAQSGWAWNVADGEIIPSTQDWNSKITPPPPVVDGGEDAKKQEPPVANDDSFGARPDALTTLPVVLNDTDPNPEDVLTIDPKSVSGWDETKGTLRISADGQSFSLLATKTVKGSAAFSYKISDGSQANGTLSKAAATVTVTFAQGTRNSAPVWCSDAPTPCVERAAPSASVLPGQSVSVEFADGFIDPEGDKVFISAASVTSGTGSAAFTAKGEVVFRSTLSKGASETAKISVTVSDTFGATTTKTLSVKVNPNTELSFNPFVVTTIVGQTKVVDILRGITGSVGQVTLVQASKDNANFKIVSPTAFSVTSSVAEQLQVAIKFTDENGVPKNSYVQVNVIDDKFAKIAVSPVTVLVRAGLDSTVDLYTAISNPSERSLIITLVGKPVRFNEAALTAGKVKDGNVRLRGQTADQAPGRVGIVRYTVSDGSSDPNYTAEGQIFVYQVASTSASPIGVDDSITLRVETTGDLDALANDVGTPGISLVLDAKEVTCEGTGFDEAGGLAFASQGVLRIVAPSDPGFYLCSYSVYSSDEPTLKSTANFGVNVTTKSSNKAPIAPTIRARVTSFATVEIPIPLSGIDPDGDTVSITGVGQSSAGKGFAAVSAKGNSVFYTVIPGQEGQDSFTYTVSDGAIESSGLVKVGIFAKYSAGGPVTMVDVIDLVAGSNGKAEFDPTANDFDANGKGLTLISGSVKPNLKEGTDAYKKSAALIAEPAKGSRAVTVSAAKEVSELEYVYSVKDGFGNVSLGAILVRVTKKAVPDQPQVLDTFVDAKERELLATSGVDVRTNKVTWLTGNPANLRLTIVGNDRGFRVSGQSTLIGVAPRTATFVVFKLSGKDFANQDAFTYGILHIPAESKVINLRDVNKVWELDEGATDEENLLDWISIPTGAAVEIDGTNVRTSGNGRPEGTCSFKSGTTVSYSAGNGGFKFNDICVVPIRYVGEESYTLLPLRIRVIANNPEPVFNNVTVEVMPGSTSEVDLKSMVSWDQENPSFSWRVQRGSGSSITEQGPTEDLITFSVVPGSEAQEQSIFSVRIGSYQSFGLITVVVGESPNAKPSAALTFDNDNCDFTSKTCSLTVNDLTGVINAFPTPLEFMPFGYTKGTPNYKTGDLLVCKDVKIKVVDKNTITATWKATTSQSCPAQIGSGALLDEEGKKGALKVTVDLQGVPQSPLLVEQVAFSRTTVTLRIKAGDFSETEFQVNEYVVREGNRIVATCGRDGNEAVTTCPAIEDLRPYRGNGDKENLHTYTVTAKNRVGESESITGAGIYAYEKLKAITPDVIEAETVLGRETATDMGVLQVKLSPREDPLAAKYVITGEGGTSAKTEIIAGDYKTRTFLLSAKPGLATQVTVRAEGAIPAPVKGSKDTSTTTWIGVVSGAPETGVASASIIGDGPFFGKITVKDANRKYSKRTAKVAYVFWPGVRSPKCTFDEATNSLAVEQIAGGIVKYADERAFNDQVVDLDSNDIAGIQQNTSYRAKVCYSNGFKVAESLAPNSLSSIAAPAPGEFEYKVELVSSTQAKSPYLFSWAVKLAKSPVIPAGVKAQFSSTESAADKWQDTIYSDYWNKRPVIKVRYCNVSATICSGSTLVGSESDSASWQVRIERAFLATADANATERPTCSPTRPLDLNFGVVGDNVAGWLGARPDEIDSGQFQAEYQLEGSTAWVALDDSRSFFRARTGVGTIKKLRFWFKPDGGTTSGLEKVQVMIDVTC